MDIRIELQDRELREALSRLVVAGEDLSPATREIAAFLKRVTEDAFDQEQDPATGEAWAPLSDVTVHPRACGEHARFAERKRLLDGSSPRMRGTLSIFQSCMPLLRFIPAHAGNTNRAPLLAVL